MRPSVKINFLWPRKKVSFGLFVPTYFEATFSAFLFDCLICQVSRKTKTNKERTIGKMNKGKRDRKDEQKDKERWTNMKSHRQT